MLVMPTKPNATMAMNSKNSSCDTDSGGFSSMRHGAENAGWSTGATTGAVSLGSHTFMLLALGGNGAGAGIGVGAGAGILLALAARSTYCATALMLSNGVRMKPTGAPPTHSTDIAQFLATSSGAFCLM